MATLWYLLTRTLNVQGAMRRGWAQTHVLRRKTEISDSFTFEQKKQLPTPTYRMPKKHQKKAISPLQIADPADVTVLGQVEGSKGDYNNRGETPSKKKKSSHKSPSKKSTKAGKTADFQSDLKNLDDKWLLNQVPNHNILLCKSTQEPLPVGGIASAVEQKCSRVCQKSNISLLLQPTILGTKTQQPVETYTGHKHPKQIFKDI